MKKLNTIMDEILKAVGKDFDISSCVHCATAIVVHDAEMDNPHCNNIECVAWVLNIKLT